MTLNKEHWENVFKTKKETEVSWYQKIPTLSIELIEKLKLPKNAAIIDVGAGDSCLIDNLLASGYTNLYVLDISENAIERLKNRLGKRAKNVTFIVTNVLDFKPNITFDVWHDRASFHFLTTEIEIQKYATIVSLSTSSNASLVIATFSEEGPIKCSGLSINQYNESKLKAVFAINFELIASEKSTHQTPFNSSQDFIFCTFKKN